MSDVDRLLEAFIAEHRAGRSPNPMHYLDRLDGLDRRELEALIDAYLVRAPRRAFDEQTFTASGAAALVEQIDRSLRGESGLWPTVLPRLRERARLKRSELVDRLAAALGVEAGREKVASYYHEMEQGLLPPAGVSNRVLEALGNLVGESAEALRRAGEALPSGPGAPEQVAFARTAPMAEAAAPAAAPRSEEAPPAWDEVDRLFRGG